MNLLIPLSPVALLLLVFFSIAGKAFISTGQLLCELEMGDKSKAARIIGLFYSHPNMFSIAMFTGALLSMIVLAAAIMSLLNPGLYALTESTSAVLIIEILIIGLVSLLFGEFIPKMIAGINPERALYCNAIPLFFFYILFYPVSWLIKGLSAIILRLFGIHLESGKNKSDRREDFDLFIQQSIEDSKDDAELEQEIKFFQNAMEFSTLKVRDCMVPRTEVVAVDTDTSLEELISLFVKTGYSKLIVYKEDVDNIIGYIHSSELFTRNADWKEDIVPLPFIPENMQANRLMKTLLEEKKSMAVVVDEFGGTAGIITLEDLVEEIFGEIEDEHDTKNILAKQIGEKEYILSGRTEIDRINEDFDLNIPESDEYMTIAGYILHHYQNLPKQHDVIQIDNYTFKIVKVSRNKIELVRLKVN